MNTLTRNETALAAQIEQVVVGGDLKSLTSEQRVAYYNRVCSSIGLNPYTRPFEYINLNGKLTLYARRDAADQLRNIHGISLSKPKIEYIDDLIVVTIEAVNRNGRTDTDLGAVNAKGLQGEAKANAIMKAITKAKRRVTLSLAGLGWLDETEVDSIPDAQRVMVDSNTGEIFNTPVIINEDVDFYDDGISKAKMTAEEWDVIEQWANRTEAEMYAVMIGACANEYEAHNSMEKSIAKCGGKVTKENWKCIYTHFLRRQMQKLGEQVQAPEQPEPEPEMAF